MHLVVTVLSTRKYNFTIFKIQFESYSNKIKSVWAGKINLKEKMGPTEIDTSSILNNTNYSNYPDK